MKSKSHASNIRALINKLNQNPQTQRPNNNKIELNNQVKSKPPKPHTKQRENKINFKKGNDDINGDGTAVDHWWLWLHGFYCLAVEPL